MGHFAGAERERVLLGYNGHSRVASLAVLQAAQCPSPALLSVRISSARTDGKARKC